MNDCGHCHDDPRRAEVRARHLNGLDYVEVELFDAAGAPLPAPKLQLHFLRAAPPTLEPENIVIEGGRRVFGKDIRILAVHPPSDESDDSVEVEVNQSGDFSSYRLRLVERDEHGEERTPAGFDQRYTEAELNFKTSCPSGLDCRPDAATETPAATEPAISYLAKDYASFRRLMLDRLAVVMPEWRERHAADLGIALVELLAYVGDQLSYYQDAVATEAYLQTARRRISVRRHARLVDYTMHEGCNARTWVCVETDHDFALPVDDFFFVTACDQLRSRGAVLEESQLDDVRAETYEVFEPLSERGTADLHFRAARSRIELYTWGNQVCCLPVGSTRATLADPGAALNLRAGMVLLFEEVIGQATGDPADADAAHRHAVRLTKAESGRDALFDQPIVEIEWDSRDALPFPLCLSTELPAPECRRIDNVSVAYGNVLLVDHGRRKRETLGPVPVLEVAGECACDGGIAESIATADDFRPTLASFPLTFRQPLRRNAPASALLAQDPRQALPALSLALIADPSLPAGARPKRAKLQANTWSARVDLLASDGDDPHFVVEIDDEGVAHVRFGNDRIGRRPDAGSTFAATYRVGNGLAGNVGAQAITHLVLRDRREGGVISVRNPLPARGGTAPEPVEQVKLLAPHMFRERRLRPITADDYARLAEEHPAVQRGAAGLHWTGSWYAVEVAVDAFGAAEAPAPLLSEVDRFLHRYRRIGHDVQIESARHVPVDLVLRVCVEPHYSRGHVEQALRDRFSNRVVGQGERGFFHPDNLTFGEGIAVSTLMAAAQAIAGVRHVRVVSLARWGVPASAIDDGVLALGPMEIAQLDSDPNFPDRGRLTLIMEGGR